MNIRSLDLLGSLTGIPLGKNRANAPYSLFTFATMFKEPYKDGEES